MPKFDDTLLNARLSSLHAREEESLIRTLASTIGIEYVDLHGVSINPEALRLISETDARNAEAAIFEQGGSSCSIAVRNPNNPATKDVVASLTAKNLRPKVFLASLDSITHAWERYSDTTVATAEKRGILDVDPDEIRKYANNIHYYLDVATHVLEINASNNAERVSHTIEAVFGGALALNASDIHIEPEQKTVRLRYRLDGVLWDTTNIERDIYNLMSSRIKLLSGLK